MIKDTTSIFNTPTRSIKGKVELYNGSTLLNTFNYNDALKSVVIDRVGESSKFFGFGICQKATIKLTDNYRQIDIVAGNSFKIYFTTGDTFIRPFPVFYVTEIQRDENTNELTIIAYDALYKANEHTVAELGLEAPYTVEDVIDAIAPVLGLSESCYVIDVVNVNAIFINYEYGVNFEETDNLRQLLDWIAEATQMVYYIDKENQLTFRGFKKDKQADITITKDDYFSLKSGDNRILSTITHATELGDNSTATTGTEGTTQFVRDNPFWELRDDIETLLNNAIVAIGGLTINQFDCEWRGNYLLEIGDKIEIVTKDDNVITSYVLNDTISYNGGLSQKTSWTYTDNEGETAESPATIGEAIKQTFAKVDRVNKEITLQVQNIENSTDDIDVIKEDIATLQISSDEVNIKIQNIESNGTGKVSTTTGYTFDDTGLMISKEDSEIKTIITEDGMMVYKNEDVVLTANNEGVEATDLHAKTYLIIGNNSRFEDYESDRTGCFWIGG